MRVDFNAEWNPTGIKFHNHVAIKHRITRELALSSKWGEIWDFNDELIGFVVRSTNAAIKVCKMLKTPVFRAIRKGDEYQAITSKENLPLLIKILKIRQNRKTQARAANSFGKS